VALSTPGSCVGRLGLVGLAGLALLAGLWAGLARIGWPLPPTEANLGALHGPLMLAGFLGLVIGLERAVATGRTWAFGAPSLAGLGALSLLVGLPPSMGAVLFVGSSVLLALIFGRIYRLRPEWSTALLMLGALAWIVGNALCVAGRSLVAVVPWWVGFLVLTIVGERLELAQVLLPARSRGGLLLAAGLLLAGLVLSAALFSAGIQLAGIGLLALAGWLARYDLARRTLARAGLPRFGAVALLLGYLWLGVTGILWLVNPQGMSAGFWYDAMLHSVFLGFAFSMIFGHAPTIVPAVTGFAVPFQRRFYVHLVLLHVSLVVRIVGDPASWPEARRWGGLLNVLAILLFVGATFAAAHHGRSAPAPESRTVPRTTSRSRVR
jgi:hypothetical protein